MEESLRQFSAYVASRLHDEGATGSRTLSTSVSGARAWIGTDDRWLVDMTIEGDLVVFSVRPADGGPRERIEVRTKADLDARFDDIAASVRAWIDRLTPHALQAGQRYRIARAFTDFHGNAFGPGELLTFRELNFVPYHDGYTLFFEERGMWIDGGSTEYADFGLLVERASA